MEKKITSFLDILIMLARGKTFIIIFTLSMSLVAVIYSLAVKERWSSDFTVFPMLENTQFSMAQNIMEGFGIGSQPTPRAINFKNSAILKSRTVTENTIRKYNLIDYFKITEADTLKAMDDAVKMFHNRILDVFLNDETYFMTVRVTTRDKYFSREIAQHYLDFLMDYTQDNPNNIGRQRRILLENRINQITNDMATLSDDLRLFQNEHNIIEIEEQVKSSIEGYGLILQELLAIEVELSHVEQILPNSMRHVNLVERRDIIIETMKRFQTGHDGMPFLLPLDNIADKAFTVQEKVFGINLYQRMLITIYPQLELARIEEVNNMDRLEIIDIPELAGRRAFPKRALICVFTFFISFIFSCACVVLMGIMSEEEKTKMKEIWRLIRNDK